MTQSTYILIALIGLFGTVFGAATGAGGLYAWFKLGPERNKLRIDAARVETTIHSSLLRDAGNENTRLSGELTQERMQLAALGHECDECHKTVASLQATFATLRVEFARNARMSELSRAKAHLALNGLGNYELLIARLLDILRDNDVPISPEMRPNRLRANLQAELNKLEELEVEAIQQQESPTDNA
jgi:hypothetical protein